MSRTTADTTAVQLDAKAVYLSPSGRACRWMMTTHPAGSPAEAFLSYCRPDGGRVLSKFADGFTLAEPNWRLLRRVA